MKLLLISTSTFGCELTISKCLSNVVLHFHHVAFFDLGGVHELTLVRAACQLTEEVHQVEETGGTTAQRQSECERKKGNKLRKGVCAGH